VRPLGVELAHELAHEGIEARLLPQTIRAGRPSRFLL
jgi:hypothetical protein